MGKKILIGTLLLIIIIVGSVQVAFADEDIAAMLTNWFDQKTEASMEEIEDVIQVEQKKQTARLKEELQLAIESANQQFDAFVEEEKSQAVEELQKHTEQLIEELDVDDEALKNEMKDKFDDIIRDARKEMESVSEKMTKSTIEESD